MQQELSLSEMCLPSLAIPQGHHTGLFLTQVIHFIHPLPVPLPNQQPQGDAPDVGVMSPCGASITKPYSLTTEIGFSAKLPARRGQHQATKEEGASTSTTQLCSEQILRGRAGCRQKTSELAFSKNAIYSPLLVTAGQGKQVQRRRPCTPGCSVVLYPTCLSRGSCRRLALYFAVPGRCTFSSVCFPVFGVKAECCASTRTDSFDLTFALLSFQGASKPEPGTQRPMQCSFLRYIFLIYSIYF